MPGAISVIQILVAPKITDPAVELSKDRDTEADEPRNESEYPVHIFHGDRDADLLRRTSLARIADVIGRAAISPKAIVEYFNSRTDDTLRNHHVSPAVLGCQRRHVLLDPGPQTFVARFSWSTWNRDHIGQCHHDAPCYLPRRCEFRLW